MNEHIRKALTEACRLPWDQDNKQGFALAIQCIVCASEWDDPELGQKVLERLAANRVEANEAIDKCEAAVRTAIGVGA